MNLALAALAVVFAVCPFFHGTEAASNAIGECGGRLIDVLVRVCKDHGDIRSDKRNDPYLMMPWGHRWTRDAKDTCAGRFANLRCMCCRSAFGPCSYEEMVVHHCQNPPQDMRERVLRINEGRR
ncbi:uncharacterized protein LOC100908023 [Galendromus occidentalis]|uniref:Uncharacterized protein LOC100908023 n=1 Tax=Galendromus occidentalis TaxID=34638 RepID=A0AAJ6VWZ8_9ACAR|nr:uncharacterized protein LOC100908023 [Galendromus occidentalis]